jgi:hypothetical protein
VLPPHWLGILLQLLRRTSSESRLFPFSNAQITRLLRSYDPDLSAHSIRRGSLTHLMQTGASVQPLSRQGRFRSAEGVLRYIPLMRPQDTKTMAELTTRLW